MNEKIDVLAAVDRAARELWVTGQPVNPIALDLISARAAIAELIEATPALLALYRIKWGNLDPDANSVLDAFERAFSRIGGGK